MFVNPLACPHESIRHRLLDRLGHFFRQGPDILRFDGHNFDNLRHLNIHKFRQPQGSWQGDLMAAHKLPGRDQFTDWEEMKSPGVSMSGQDGIDNKDSLSFHKQVQEIESGQGSIDDISALAHI